jgi:hypothetical protein
MRAVVAKSIFHLGSAFFLAAAVAACLLIVGCKRQPIVEAKDRSRRAETKDARDVAENMLFPLGGERAIPNDVASAILECEGAGAPCRGSLDRVLFVAKRPDGRFDVLRPVAKAKLRRNDGHSLTVLEKSDLEAASRGDGFSFLQLELTKQGVEYEAVSVARSVNWRQSAVALCGTERLLIRKADGIWACVLPPGGGA